MALLRGENSFFEIGHTGYKKIENFMLISKMQTYFSDKVPQKKLKWKKMKKWDLAKLENSFLIVNFFFGGGGGGHFFY